MIRGLRTVIYPVGDLAAGRRWYARAFGVEPYFDEPYYVGFAVGGFELGLVPDGTPGTAGALAYWGVADAKAAFAKFLELGAAEHEAPKDVGGGITVASVLDPFGNAVGLIENPSFDPSKIG